MVSTSMAFDHDIIHRHRRRKRWHLQQRPFVSGSNERRDPFGAISMPIYQNAAYAHPGLGKSTGYDYSRCGNPTRDEVQKTVALLEQGTEALAFSTGMAAITALMEIFLPGII